MSEELASPHGRLGAISAVAGYELRSSLKRRKVLAVVAVIVAFSALTFILGPYYETQYFGTAPNPFAAVTPHYDFAFGGETGFLVLAVIMAVDQLSGEFEQGTLEMLLAKPVFRWEVYGGKLAAGAVLLAAAIGAAVLVDIPVATIMYGPQRNLFILTAYVAGWFLTGMVFLSMVYAIASLTKSTVLTVAITLLYWAVVYSVPNVASLWFMDFVPGWGAGLSQPGVGSGVSGIGSLLAYHMLNPAGQVAYQGSGSLESAVNVLMRAVGVGSAYFVAFLGLGYHSFKKAQLG